MRLLRAADDSERHFCQSSSLAPPVAPPCSEPAIPSKLPAPCGTEQAAHEDRARLIRSCAGRRTGVESPPDGARGVAPPRSRAPVPALLHTRELSAPRRRGAESSPGHAALRPL